MPLPYLKELFRPACCRYRPCGEGAGGAQKHSGILYRSIPVNKGPDIKNIKKRTPEKKGNNVFNWPGTFDGEKAALDPE
jgi:hypothetical protein